MVSMLWPQSDARAVVQPESAPLGLLFRHLQPLLLPDPLDPLVVHEGPLQVQKSHNSAVTVAPVVACQGHYSVHQRRLVGRYVRNPPLCVPCLPEDRTGPALADAVTAKSTSNVLHRQSPR